jgi:beta-N-acetylhexosaminidase
MRRLSRGSLLLVVAAVGAFAAGTGVSLLFSDSDSTPPNRVLRPTPAAAAPPAARPAPKPKASRRSPAAIAARLPTPQLIAQLFVVGVHGTTASRATLRSVRTRAWGGIVLTPANWLGPGPTRRLTAKLAGAARAAHRLPLLVGASADLPGVALPHGTRAPSARRHAAVVGRALRAAGVNLALGPDADVGTAGGPLENQSVANAPGVVSRVVAAALQGYRRANTIAAVGHFPGQGAAAGNPETEPAPVGQSLAELRARDLRPFAAVARTAPVVVASNAIYAAFDGATPAVLLPEAVTGLLRQRMGFRGVVMSDDLLAASTTNHTDVGATSVGALRAGADLLYVPGGPRTQNRAYAAVLGAWRRGTISTARLRASAARVLALKRAYRILH